MSIDLSKQDTNVGDIIYRWKIKEYEQQDRPKRWYIVMGVIAVLLIIFSVWTTNYLFILVIVLFSIILMLHGIQKPIEIDFVITQLGIVVGQKFYKYSEIENFWVIYNPPEVKNLYFGFNKFFKHRLSIPLHNYDPRPIRKHLLQYVEEDLEQENEPFSETLARMFRLY